MLDAPTTFREKCQNSKSAEKNVGSCLNKSNTSHR